LLNSVSGDFESSNHREERLTGTAVLSFKPTDRLLTYASYSRGYKAGGFNLDRSALKSPILPFSAAGGAQALVGGLQFDPEIVDAFEIGGKYSARGLTVNVSAFRQQFKNFQLNTFDGTVFIVQNVNGCTDSLGVTDEDQSKFSGGANFVPPVGSSAAALTGACDKDNVGYGVRSQGVELEASYRLMRDLRINTGITVSKTSYRDDLVGTDNGAPLNPALRKLPGRRLSNAPGFVATGAIAYTPSIGSSGLSALFYVDGRYSAKYNTGSDLFPQKGQEAYTVINARLGLRGADEKWGIEVWAQNLLKKDYTQVAFNSPFQEGATSTTAAFADPQYPGGRQIFSAFLAEPRTYGLTLRGRFSSPKPVPATYVAPPAPVVPAPAVQTCADGSVIAVDAACPIPAPPPAPAPAPERG
jgi:outer membrane receptor protein involved in Fe transport